MLWEDLTSTDSIVRTNGNFLKRSGILHYVSGKSENTGEGLLFMVFI
jgi:hypothetical protein